MQNESKLAAESVSKIDSKIPTKSQNSKCFRCSCQHNLKVCPFIDKECFFCKNKGHSSRVCRMKAKSNLPTQQFSNAILETPDEGQSDEDFFMIYHLHHKKST